MTKPGKPAFADLFELPEEERIVKIGNAAMNGGVVGFVVEMDGEKGDRYLARLFKLYPKLELKGRFPGLVDNAELIKVCRKQKQTEVP